MKRHPTWLLLLAVAAIPTCAPVATASLHAKEDAAPARLEQSSGQPATDAWITTKVKAALLAAADVPGMDIRVETTDGTVHLSGHVPTQENADRAITAARRIDGVSRVDSSSLIVGEGASSRP